ncbi:GspE/PulE family protein [Nitrospina gracilis]|uniref:GspE/PulE family protein n=1 Tax=Nitrospina gracilis TaxID=35801 RepID=UPI001F2BE4A6|nr:ATPase, T2SS/T4P/T4SS family [Nitrospina gracilis]MCF8721915.1 type IV pilus assembly protein PilB [Nitrospina gracilis Nb-211]
MAIKSKLRLGDILIRAGVIDESQLLEALEIQKKTGMQLGKVLLQMKYITDKDLVYSLSEQMDIPQVDLENIKISNEAIELVEEKFARKSMLIPFKVEGKTLNLAITNPFDLFAIDEIAVKTKMDVVTWLATETEVHRAIEEYYGVASSIQDVVKHLGVEDKKKKKEEAKQPEGGTTTDAPVKKLVDLILVQALEDGASDIHIEPYEKILLIRYRIDGVLFEAKRIPKSIESAFISRLKVMANMDIAETRAPQDGGFSRRLEGKNIEFRVSSCPTIYGENLVIRILDRSKLTLTLDDLGLIGGGLEKFQKLLRNPYGVILVTGPTGSGKTTTLYASLSQLNTPDRNIKTIEDPVEYRLDGIRQTQVNPKANITFATGLRSLMRQDPDIVMVGEIRDAETAQIAIQAALTGQLVLSTLHTNDTASTISRLTEFGIEPFLMVSSIMGILAQRLVRRICSECKVERPITPEEMKIFEMHELEVSGRSLYHGEGCKSCKNSGYRGRVGIYEVLLVDDIIRKMILDRSAPMDIRDRAISTQGLRTLRLDGLSKVLEGFTTVEELDRMTFTEDSTF